MAKYEPGLLDSAASLDAVKQYLVEELRKIAVATSDQIHLQELNVAPKRPRVGDIVLADGTHWNPGAGGGFYGYHGGSWAKLG